MSEREQQLFYVTMCSPGRAEGASDWNDYSAVQPFEPEEEIDQNFDEEGEPRPLDWFFNDN